MTIRKKSITVVLFLGLISSVGACGNEDEIKNNATSGGGGQEEQAGAGGSAAETDVSAISSGGIGGSISSVTGGRDTTKVTGGRDTSQVTGGRDTSQVTGGRDTSEVTGGRDASEVTGGRDTSEGTGGQDAPSVTGGEGGASGQDSKACCPDGDCICRGEEPVASSNENGPYQYESYVMPSPQGYRAGTVYYPTDAEPPFAAAVFCPPLTGVQIMYAAWGPFLASWGIVLETIDTITPADIVDSRATQQQAAIEQLRAENTRPDSPLFGKLSDRFGAMGWSMGGGATWITASVDPALKSAITLAGHNMTSPVAMTCSARTAVPSMQLNGAQDMTILGGLGQSNGVYNLIPDTTPKLLFVVNTTGHFGWSGPNAPLSANPAKFLLAFQKGFLEGDMRWKKFLVEKPADAAVFQTNVTP
ncbi:MAG: hypothetical protein JXA30_13135 [Deltaproteobacteria bacterium]|nr:hypothetical protein [Deltaproteobacteria bacterium]